MAKKQTFGLDIVPNLLNDKTPLTSQEKGLVQAAKGKKMKQTFADRAKQIMNKYKIRLGEKFDKGDTLALAAMNQELEALQQEQEQARIAKQEADAAFEQDTIDIFANGGKLNRKQQKTLSTILTNRKEETFAYGGGLPTYEGDQDYSNFLATPNQYVGQSALPDRSYGASMYNTALPTQQQQQHSGLPDLNTVDAAANDSRRFTPGQFDRFAPTPTLTTPELPTNFGNPNGLNLGNPNAGNFNTGEGYLDTMLDTSAIGDRSLGNAGAPEPFSSRVPWIGAVAQGLGSILENRKIDFGENEYKAQEVSPNLVDYSREREGFRRDRDNANAMIRQGAKGFGSKEALMGSTIAGVTGTQRQAGKLTSQSLQGEENQNAQIKNQTAFFNAQQKNIADRLNTQQDRENLLINENRRSNLIGGVTNAATGYGRDLMNADQYDQMLQMMAPENYMLTAGKDSGLRKFLQVSRPMQRSFLKGSQTLSS